MRKYLILAILLLSMLTGCQQAGNYVAMSRSHSAFDGKIHSNHNYLNGDISYKLGIAPEIEVDYKIVTDQGELNFEVENAESFEEIDEDTILILNPEENIVKIKINAEEHKGSYDFEIVEKN